MDEAGRPNARDLARLGGAYSFYIRLWRGGVGSPRMIYLSGIPAFDRLRRDVDGELAFVTWEELQEGWLLRLNINQRLACVGIRKADLAFVDLQAVRMLVGRGQNRRIVHRGTLTLSVRDGQEVQLQLPFRQYASMQRYLSKSSLSSRLRITLDPAAPEEDGGHP